MNDDAPDTGPLTPFEEQELLDWAAAKVRAAKTPRLLVTFYGDDGQPFTVGPVLAVMFEAGVMVAHSCADDADPIGHGFTLAVFDPEAGGWRVNDGLEDGPVYRGWRVHAAGE